MKVEADSILATSKIAGEAREKLRAVLDEIVAGIDAVAGRDKAVSPLDGLVRADEALARYAKGSTTRAGRHCSRWTRAPSTRPEWHDLLPWGSVHAGSRDFPATTPGITSSAGQRFQNLPVMPTTGPCWVVSNS